MAIDWTKFSDSELESISKGDMTSLSDATLMKLSGEEQPAPQQPQSGMQKAGDVLTQIGSWMEDKREEWTPYAKQVPRALLEYGGAVGGGLIGGGTGLLGGPAAPATSPMAAALGTGLGYAGGRQAANALESFLGYGKPQSLGQAAAQAAVDVPLGMGMEAGGQVVAKGVSKALPYVGKLAERMYTSALKPSTALAEKEVKSVINTGLTEGIPVSHSGLSKSQNIITSINDTITKTIDAIKGANVSTQKALQPVRNYYNMVPSKNITPQAEQQIIGNYIKEVENTQSQYISTPLAQKFKQTLNKDLTEYYNALAKGKIAPEKTLAKTKEAMADGLRGQITEMFPALGGLNAREGALINLNKSLSKAVHRISNRELIPIAMQILIGDFKWALKTLAVKTLDQPYVKSQLAIALKKSTGALPIAIGKMGSMAGLNQSPEQSSMQGENILDMLAPIGNAQASGLADYARGMQTRNALAEIEKDGNVMGQKKENTYETVANEKVKQLSNGSWVVWDDAEQAWVPMKEKMEAQNRLQNMLKNRK